LSAATIKKKIAQALRRKPSTHKGDYGKILVLAGSTGMTGAAALVCLGALRSGAGLITLGIPRSLNNIMEIKLTEIMTLPLPETTAGTLGMKAGVTLKPLINTFDAVVLGPGISQHTETKRFVQLLLPHIRVPLVIDADGLNALCGCPEILAKIKSSVIITPHPREFSRLFNVKVTADRKSREQAAVTYSLKYGMSVVLKGYRTVIAAGKKIYTNTTGNPGLATGGSGDVLTGIIASFLGQGLDSFCASQYGVFIHGLAADIAVGSKTQISLIPSDVIDCLPQAFRACGL